MSECGAVRGQRLFIRSIEASDHTIIRDFLARHSISSPVPSAGLLGKLVGDLVAIVAVEVRAPAIEIHDIVVAPELRRKRIGRFMVDEVARLARTMGCDRLVADQRCEAREMLSRLGFEYEGQDMVRRVG